MATKERTTISKGQTDVKTPIRTYQDRLREAKNVILTQEQEHRALRLTKSNVFKNLNEARLLEKLSVVYLRELEPHRKAIRESETFTAADLKLRVT
jgi:hypothetical protein